MGARNGSPGGSRDAGDYTTILPVAEGPDFMKQFKGLMIVLALLGGVAMLPVETSDGGETVSVQGGDSLSKLAKRHKVTVEQLRNWNELKGDLIKVGQVLQIDAGGSTRPLWRVLREMLPTREAPAQIAERPRDISTKPSVRTRQAKRTGSSPRAGLYQDQLGRYIDDEGRFVNADGAPIDENGNVLEDAARSWAPLTRPAPKPCLDSFTGTGGGGEQSFGRSEGLSSQQVSRSIARFQEQTLRCADGHSSARGGLSLELVISCDGRVKSVEVLDDGVQEGAFAACVADVMRYAAFPAHARDEVTVQIPLRYD